MSQNKTVIQGLESPDPRDNKSQANSFYARNTNAPASARGTVVPGMNDSNIVPQPQSFSGAVPSQESAVTNNMQRAAQTGKPIVGFLYSISRTPLGEFWPLQIGRNTIGQNEDCDIRLYEGTVSSNHAIIVTRQVKGGVIAAITDAQSTNGTMINGETIGFSAEECHNGDVITIGNNYQLVLVLIDCAKMGLSVSENFVPVEIDDKEEAVEDDVPSFDLNKTTRCGIDTNSGWGKNGPSASNVTIGIDGNIGGLGHGGTKAI